MASGNSTRHGNRFIDLTGQRFGKWMVISEAETRSGAVCWNCLCDCGRMSIVPGKTLRYGSSSCCVHCRGKTHGMSTSGEFSTWIAMRDRCERATNAEYRNYGGRGITVCERWKNSFQAFLDDMGPRPSNSHSIDRINNDGNYEPGNCRWATRSEQMCNMRRNRLLTFSGMSKPVAEWAKELGMSPETLHSRLRLGWTVERALTTPPHKRSRFI